MSEPDQRKIPKGADAFVQGVVGRWKRRRTIYRKFLAEATRASLLEPELSQLRDAALRGRIRDVREVYARNREIDAATRIQAIALVREAARRSVHLHPFEVQLTGALVLDHGGLVEMATGEGKTLTSGLAAVLGAWRRKPVHVVTVNDYLVQRDCDWLSRLYRYCGLESRHVAAGMPESDRRHAYAAPITYGTSKEIAADFLRDRIRAGGSLDPLRRKVRHLLADGLGPGAEPVMRGLYRAIVDEADSLLIDEAVTPLILSRKVPNESLNEVVRTASRIAGGFLKDVHYKTDPRYREVELSEAGKAQLEREGLALHGIWRSPARREEIVKQALVARVFHLKGENYIVDEGKIVIVDEFTGRPMPDRSWRQGLHQAVEAKENLEMTDPTETLSRISFQRFFRKYKCLSGMSGTAFESRDELWRVYELPVIRIPTNRPCIRIRKTDRYYATEAAKLEAIATEVEALHRRELPVLVGTRTVETSERLAVLLAERKLEAHVLNAQHIRAEADIVSLAGMTGRITIATNMAGRGTDIRLAVGVAEAGGLQVIAAEKHESVRIDRQLYGRAGRQGDPGTARQYASAEDALLQKYLSPGKRYRLSLLLREDIGTNSPVARFLFRKAQNTAQRQFARQRKRIQEQDERLDEGLAFGRE